jgi:hypothetical protein
VGSKPHVEKFDQRFRVAADSGVTRLEVSIFFNNTAEYRFKQPSMHNLLALNGIKFVDRLLSDVLNNAEVLKEVYKSLNFHKLIHNLGNVDNNILAIGS